MEELKIEKYKSLLSNSYWSTDVRCAYSSPNLLNKHQDIRYLVYLPVRYPTKYYGTKTQAEEHCSCRQIQKVFLFTHYIPL